MATGMHALAGVLGEQQARDGCAGVLERAEGHAFDR